jgi:hypothetical protein
LSQNRGSKVKMKRKTKPKEGKIGIREEKIIK